MKKISAFVFALFFILMQGMCLFSCENGEGADSTFEESERKQPSITVQHIQSFHDTTTPITFTMDGQEYYGIVNTQGEIVYYRSGRFIWNSIGNGAGYIDIDGIYTLINAEGKEVIIGADGEFDKIIGSGGGMILVYKNTSTISAKEHSYGVIDSDGNWISSLKPLEKGAELPPKSEFRYMGEGVFGDGSVLYNSKNHEAFRLVKCEIINDMFIDGCVYVKANNRYIEPILYYFQGGLAPQKMPAYFAFSSDGTYTTLNEAELNKHVNQDTIFISDRGKYLQITSNGGEIVATYENFPSHQIENEDYQSFEDKILILIKGMDEKYYFTVINTKGEQQFEPIECAAFASYGKKSNIHLTNDRVVYIAPGGEYAVVDTNGKAVLSKHNYITAFSQGRAIVDRCTMIDLDGNSIEIKLHQSLLD